MELTSVLAHGSGVDDLLLIYGPIFLFLMISWMKTRRSAKHRDRHEDSPE